MSHLEQGQSSNYCVKKSVIDVLKHPQLQSIAYSDVL